jgi:hypothetical protein
MLASYLARRDSGIGLVAIVVGSVLAGNRVRVEH